MATTRRQFSQEFKLEAVRRVKESGKPQAQIARELGIRPAMLRTWKRQAAGRVRFAAPDAVAGPDHPSSRDEELQQVRRENERLRQARDFLKKRHDRFGHHHPMKMCILERGLWQPVEVELAGAASSQKS